MKVKTITYSRVFPLASYVNEKVGIEVELDDNDGFDETFEYAKGLVNGWGQKPLGFIAEPHEFQGLVPKHNFTANQPIPTKDIAEEKSTADRVIEQINECKDLKVLESFKLIAQKNEKIWGAYIRQKDFIELYLPTH